MTASSGEANPALALVRPNVAPTDRIRVVGQMIRKRSPRRVLELGAGDYSFESVADPSRTSWVKADWAQPCDVVCEFNSQDLHLPWPDESFDLIVITEVLEHLLWPESVLREARRLLPPTGGVLISVPNAVSLSYRIAWAIGHLPSCAACGNLSFGPTTYRTESGMLMGGHVIDFSKSRLTQLLGTTGFRVAEMRGSGIIRRGQLLPHWLVPPSLASNLICLGAPA